MFKRLTFLTGFIALYLAAASALAPAQASGYYDDLGSLAKEYSSCVAKVGIKGPSRCNAANGHGKKASQAAEENFTKASLHNGKGDAFRHCYWNARMTIDFGAGDAKKIADNHERVVSGPQREESMDKSNNNRGRTATTSRALAVACPER